MIISRPSASTLLAIILTASLFLPKTSDATIVEIQTVVGNFEVNLYDNTTPATVTNFLIYVNNGAYTNSIIHRAAVPAGFIVQGGGFTFGLAWPATAIAQNPSVVNEPELSNVRGTIAMAKLASDPNSATSQWFINLDDNSAGGPSLDTQNGGFTVFGEVVGNGMDIVDAIDALQRFNFNGAFNELPLRSVPVGDPDASNLVVVNRIEVTDTTVDSAAGLNPPVNTLINPPPQPVPPVPAPTAGGGGGSLGLISLFALLLVSHLRACWQRRSQISIR